MKMQAVLPITRESFDLIQRLERDTLPTWEDDNRMMFHQTLQAIWEDREYRSHTHIDVDEFSSLYNVKYTFLAPTSIWLTNEADLRISLSCSGFAHTRSAGSTALKDIDTILRQLAPNLPIMNRRLVLAVSAIVRDLEATHCGYVHINIQHSGNIYVTALKISVIPTVDSTELLDYQFELLLPWTTVGLNGKFYTAPYDRIVQYLTARMTETEFSSKEDQAFINEIANELVASGVAEQATPFVRQLIEMISESPEVRRIGQVGPRPVVSTPAIEQTDPPAPTEQKTEKETVFYSFQTAYDESQVYVTVSLTLPVQAAEVLKHIAGALTKIGRQPQVVDDAESTLAGIIDATRLYVAQTDVAAHLVELTVADTLVRIIGCAISYLEAKGNKSEGGVKLQDVEIIRYIAANLNDIVIQYGQAVELVDVVARIFYSGIHDTSSPDRSFSLYTTYGKPPKIFEQEWRVAEAKMFPVEVTPNEPQHEIRPGKDELIDKLISVVQQFEDALMKIHTEYPTVSLSKIRKVAGALYSPTIND